MRSGFFRDEASTWFFAGLPWRDLFPAIARIDSNPPGFYALCWLLRHGFPNRPYVLELLSLAASLTLPVLAFAIGTRLHSRAAGIIAAFAVALSPIAIREASDARAYSLAACACCVAFLALERLAARFSIRSAIVSATCLAAAWYLHYSAIVFFLCLFPALLIGSETWAVARRLCSAYALAAVAYLPWLTAAIEQTRVGSPTLDRWSSLGYDPRIILRTFAYLLPFASSNHLKLLLPILILAIVALWAFVCAKTSASARIAGIAVALTATFCALAFSGAQGSRYAFVTVVFANVVWFAMASDVARYAFAHGAAAGRYARYAFALGIGALAIVFGVRAGIRATEPKSGITAFWESEKPGPGSIVIGVPDFLGPSIAFAGRFSPQVERESFVMDSCPAWMRFIGGYEQQWSDRALRAKRLEALLNDAAGRRVYLVVQDHLHAIGRVDFATGDVVERAFRRRFTATSERTFFGTVEETVRVVTFRGTGRIGRGEDPRSACSEINGVDAPFSAAEFAATGP